MKIVVESLVFQALEAAFSRFACFSSHWLFAKLFKYFWNTGSSILQKIIQWICDQFIFSIIFKVPTQ